jgi:hypothetical protein
MNRKPIEYIKQDCGYTTPCWVWQKSILAVGYGCVRINAKTKYAHRVYYERLVGPIPDGLELDHLCRNRACVNPEHLEAVSHRVNARRGARTKLRFDEVVEIKRRLRDGVVQRLVAVEFSISKGAIADISAGRTWREVKA